MDTKTGSGGVGLGLDINLRLGELQNTLTMLTDAIQQAGGKVTETMTSAVRKIRQAGIQDLKQAKEREGGRGQASDMYGRLVTQLQDAARRGENEARNLLNELGEKVEATGQQAQRTAQKGQQEQGQQRR